MEKTITVQMAIATSSNNQGTGAASMWRIKGDSSKEWNRTTILSPKRYMNETLALRILINTLEDAAYKVRQEYPEQRIKITCLTSMDTIVKGFNIQRGVWESNGFINRRGNKVKDSQLWRKLFRLADGHNITLRKPKKFSDALKGCFSLAKSALVHEDDAAEQQQILAQATEAAAKDAL